MGIIAAVKTSYKMQLLELLLDIMCDTEEKYNECLRNGELCRRGCKGIAERQKPHILDAMNILKQVWNNVKSSSLIKCWEKANILPSAPLPFENNEKNNSNFNTSTSQEFIDNLNTLCDKINNFTFVPNMLVGSFADKFDVVCKRDGPITLENIDSWLTVEDNPDVLILEIDEALEALEISSTSNTSNHLEVTRVESTSYDTNTSCIPITNEERKQYFKELAEICDKGVQMNAFNTKEMQDAYFIFKTQVIDSERFGSSRKTMQTSLWSFFR